MNYSAFEKTLGKGEPTSVYLITGTEEFLKQEALALVRKKVLAGGDPAFRLSEFTGGETEDRIGEVLDELCTMPMMGGRRLVIIDRANRLADKELKSLARFAKSPPGFSTLALVATEEIKKRGKSITKTKLEKSFPDAVVMHAGSMYERDAANWLRARAVGRGFRLGSRVESLLLDYFGTDLSELDSALEKLTILAGPDTPVTSEHVEGFLRRRVGYDIFKFTGAVASRNAKHALEVLSDIFEGGIVKRDGTRETNEQAIFMQLVPMMGREFRKIYEFKRIVRGGTPPDVAAKKFVGHPFFAKQFAKDAARYTEAECLSAGDAILQADSMLKNGRRSGARLALEECIIKCMTKADEGRRSYV